MVAKPKVFVWPIPDVAAICQLQSTSGAADLLLNGNITISSSFPGMAVFPGITRTVSLTSANNLSGRNFTITGLLNGSQISEVIAGPNANTVETTAIFDQVTNVHVNGSVSAVSIGTGKTGRTHWFNYDYDNVFPSLSVQSVVSGTINYTFNVTLDDVQTNLSPSLSSPFMTASTTSEFHSLGTFPISYSSVVINSSGSNGALRFIYLQSGTGA